MIFSLGTKMQTSDILHNYLLMLFGIINLYIDRFIDFVVIHHLYRAKIDELYRTKAYFPWQNANMANTQRSCIVPFSDYIENFWGQVWRRGGLIRQVITNIAGLLIWTLQDKEIDDVLYIVWFVTYYAQILDIPLFLCLKLVLRE